MVSCLSTTSITQSYGSTSTDIPITPSRAVSTMGISPTRSLSPTALYLAAMYYGCMTRKRRRDTGTAQKWPPVLGSARQVRLAAQAIRQSLSGEGAATDALHR